MTTPAGPSSCELPWQIFTTSPETCVRGDPQPGRNAKVLPTVKHYLFCILQKPAFKRSARNKVCLHMAVYQKPWYDRRLPPKNKKPSNAALTVSDTITIALTCHHTCGWFINLNHYKTSCPMLWCRPGYQKLGAASLR